ncbi:glycosyltransferase [Bradyrhizobium arachidis]|uniref:Glycosyltransferase n=1 Tax=Bradyrhizobium arachidis TaxID=858423 RepID=A0AAE7NKN5_9BRAD|nr:glycosyltransferase [Bradyrhizobium arachidis]QOZ67056.1 glycosyltransferase [Bradyrhizobium arachidis]SFV16972.1 UDP:flavonoid glycosyltransferase YjiC, YdhE family [Bradyrhizobium arachidis]
MSYDFLLASWGTLGNLSPMLTAARRLRQNGHRIRVMADPAMRSEVEASGFAFVTWRRAPTGTAADPVDVSDINDFFRRAIFDPAVLYAADLRDEIGRVPTDAVLVLDVLFGGALGAEASGLPFALLSPHVSLRPLPGVPPATSGLTQPKTPEQRAEVDAANVRQAETINAFLLDLNRARADLGLFPLRDVFDLFDRASRLLLATSRAFDFQADTLPDNLRYVGPLLDVPNWSKSLETEAWRAPWSARSGRPRALIACSTGAQGQRDMFQRILDAMEAVEVDALATAGPNLDVADLRAPKNVHLVRGAPHDLVMKDVSVVISQGGHGTTTRSLINGLPQLILPMGRDQAANAARIEAKGAGLQLPPTASEVDIAAAVNRLIAEPRFRMAAGLLGEAMKADIDRSSLVEEMEAIAATGRAARRQPNRLPLRKSA